MNKKKVHIVFWIFFPLSIALTIALLVVYFVQFNGALSYDISDWADFSSFIYGLSTVFLTSINVWLFYRLTSSANEINEKGKATSDGIIDTYTQEERKRSQAEAGVELMQEYTKSQSELLQLLNTKKGESVDYKAIRITACQLETIYQILHNSNQIFPSLHVYERHDEYLAELQGIANQTSDEPHQIIEPGQEQMEFRAINAFQAHHSSVITYFEEIMDCIQTDLGSIYTVRIDDNNQQ